MSTLTQDAVPALASPPVPAPAETDLTLRVRRAGRAVAVLLCALHAFSARHSVCPDGLNYLDVAAAYQRGDWANAVNSYWSPLYSWLLAGVLTAVRPSTYWEASVAHAVNFAVFLAALACFEWLLTELLHRRRHLEDEAADRWQVVLPDWAFAGVLYALFIWVSRRLVTVSLVTPDMLVAALVYAAVALMLRQRRLGGSAGLSLVFGVVLGLGYLAKAVLFPLGLVFLATSALTAATWRRALAHVAVAGLAFVLVAGPFVTALSLQRGRATFGDSGRLNYLWYVNGAPPPHRLAGSGWQPRADRAPALLMERPRVTAFARPGGGSYPLSYDMAWWWEGCRPVVSVGAQARGLIAPGRFYYSLVAENLLAFSGAVAVLFGFAFFARREGWRAWLRARLGGLLAEAPLLLPAGAALGLYLLVGHAEARLVGPFVLLLFAGLLLALRFRHPQQLAVRPLSAALLTGLAALLAVNLLFDAGTAAAELRQGEGAKAHSAWGVAEELRALGVRPGDGVGCVGFSYDAYWARLAGVQIVAEVPEEDAAAFFAAGPEGQAAARRCFRSAGARAVVSDRAPAGAAGWRPVPGTRYAVLMIGE
jgi:hypothetical protein